jgi:hypothetical protein
MAEEFADHPVIDTAQLDFRSVWRREILAKLVEIAAVIPKRMRGSVSDGL